jgi:hypothetical protein
MHGPRSFGELENYPIGIGRPGNLFTQKLRNYLVSA